jgi:hypothetical protein
MEKFAKKGMAALFGLALISAAGLAQAETRFAVQNNAGADKFVVTDTGSIGVNIANPTYKLHLVGEGDTASAAILVSAPGRQTDILGTAASDSGGFSFMRNNHSTINLGLPRAGDRLGYFGFGSNIAGANRWLGVFSVFSETAASTTSAPTYMTFATASANTFNAAERMRINSVGNVGIGTTAPTQRLEVNGGVRLLTATPKPGCAIATRGVLWFTQAGAGAADTLEVCGKDANGNYDWRPLY